MNCSSFIPSLVLPNCGGPGSGEGTTNYDYLSNRPVRNISGNPVVISALESGVYNIDGSWVITADGEPRATYKDDMFYVLNENGVCKMTWITAGEIYTYSSKMDGDASFVEEDRLTKESDTIGDPDNMVGAFGDSGTPAGISPAWIGSF